MQVLLFGLLAGAAGYLITTFWFQPMLSYRSVRERVHSDLIYFADAINATGLNNEMKERVWARANTNRRHSADLRAIFVGLPWWYRKWLSARNHKPEQAAKELMGLSNTFTHEEAAARIEKIRNYLGLPSTS